jgi:hypothetical protein
MSFICQINFAFFYKHTCQPLKPLMREISPSAMTAEGEILRDDTICSIICAKQNQNMECYEYCPDSEVLKKAKTRFIAE